MSKLPHRNAVSKFTYTMNETSSTIELVVARYRENPAWLRRIPSSVRLTLYNKGPDMSDFPAISLPNIGREAHTYLHHIVTRYNSLSDITVFCQGNPFDHVPDFRRIITHIPAHPEYLDDFLWLGFIIDYDDPDGCHLFQNWTSANPDRAPLPLREIWTALFHKDPPEKILFFPGAQFSVRKEIIHNRPVEFYQHALELACSLPHAAHAFERIWDDLFDVNGIPAEFRDADMPVYLRPVERLGITWDDIPAQYHPWARYKQNSDKNLYNIL